MGERIVARPRTDFAFSVILQICRVTDTTQLLDTNYNHKSIMIPRISMSNKNLLLPFIQFLIIKPIITIIKPIIKIKAKYHPSQGDETSLWYRTNLFRNKNFETIPLHC